MIKYARFSSETKLSDMVHANYTLLSILPRFDINLGFGDRTVTKVCCEQNIDEAFFLMVCNLHSFEGYRPSDAELYSTNLLSVVNYLKRSHLYYINTRIAAIENKLKALSATIDPKHYEMVASFFEEYKREVLNHFHYEEREVFPYISELIDGKCDTAYNIHSYEENHNNIDDKLSDLKNILLKYLPDNSSPELRIEILQDIFLFEDDLDKHTRIEDRILMPLAKRMEEFNGQ